MPFAVISRRACAAVVAISIGIVSIASFAQASRPLHAILPVSAGSGVDTIIRSMGPSLNKALGGQAFVIENLPGAGGITGTLAIVKAAPDGATIGVVSNNHVINPSVYKSLPFDSLRDITPIMVVGSTAFVVVVNPNKMAVNNLKEFAALMKANPAAYNYASSGNGTVLHLGDEMLLDQLGVGGTHIPYKGVGPMITDLMGGQVDWAVTSIPSVQGHIKNGTLRAIAVPSKQRSTALPDVATSVEQGMPDFLIDGWFAVVGPARMPPAEVRRIHAAFTQAIAMPDVKEAMDKQGNVIAPMSPEQSAAYFKSEFDRFAQLVKKANVKVD